MRLQSKDYLLVGLQILLFFIYFLDFRILELFIPEFVKNIGLMLTIIGGLILLLALIQLNKNLSPFPTPKSGSRLIKNGLYKFVRHPIYSGILLGFGGFAVYSSSGYRIMVCLLLYVLFSVKTRYEEKLLLKKYKGYSAYMDKTGKFIPKISKN